MNTGADRGSRPQASSALSGRLSAVSLFDLCQFLMLNRKTGTLTVRSGGKSAYFTFQDGQLMTALDDAFRNGESVVLTAVQWPDGEFSFDPGPVPPDRKIQASTENILLEAARRIDEMHAEVGEGDETPSREEKFRETQARAAGLAEAFRNAVSGSAAIGRQTHWKAEVLDALGSGKAICALFGQGDYIALAGASGVGRIDGVPRQDWMAWIRSLAGEGADSGRRAPAGPAERIIRSNGMSLLLRRHGGPVSGQAFLTRLQEAVPAWEELGLEDGIYSQLEAAAPGPWIVLDTERWLCSFRGPSPPRGRAGLSWAGPAFCATAAWVRRRNETHPGTAWVVERAPFYEWSSLPGSVRSLHPDRLRGQGHLSELCSAVGATTLVLARPWNAALAAEAAELAGPGIAVAILDHASDAGEWIRRRNPSFAPRGEGWAGGIAGIWSLRSGPEGNSIHSTIVLPRPQEDAA